MQKQKSFFRVKVHKARTITEQTLPSTPTPSISSAKFFKNNKQKTLMVDDYKDRKTILQESFMLKKYSIMKLKIGVTEKFFYITLHNTRTDSHYKLRLLLKTGQKILQRIKVRKSKFCETLFQDDLKKWYFSAPFPPWERKFYFTPIQPSKVKEEACDNQDEFVSDEIKNIDRTYVIFQNCRLPTE